jgi:hypothetical protein
LPAPDRSITSLLRRLTAACALLAIGAGVAAAQRPDSARVAAAPRPPSVPSIAGRDSLAPPLTPKRAFLYSLLAPGYAQTVLGRPTAAAVYVLAEAVAALMILESSASLRSVFPGTDPVTGAPRPRVPSSFPRSLVRSRQAQLEDWIAVLLFNHAFAGADAFVAAHLWDVPARVGGNQESRQLSVGATIRW